MESEWLDIACINHEKYILHGQIEEVKIEQTLTSEEKAKVDELFFKHDRELRALLKGFVNE